MLITSTSSFLSLRGSLTLYSIDTHFQQQTAFENIVGKEEIARNEHFLLFPQCFLLNQKIVSPFVNIYDIISLFAAELEDPKMSISGKGLNLCGKGEGGNLQKQYLENKELPNAIIFSLSQKLTVAPLMIYISKNIPENIVVPSFYSFPTILPKVNSLGLFLYLE